MFSVSPEFSFDTLSFNLCVKYNKEFDRAILIFHFQVAINSKKICEWDISQSPPLSLWEEEELWAEANSGLVFTLNFPFLLHFCSSVSLTPKTAACHSSESPRNHAWVTKLHSKLDWNSSPSFSKVLGSPLRMSSESHVVHFYQRIVNQHYNRKCLWDNRVPDRMYTVRSHQGNWFSMNYVFLL